MLQRYRQSMPELVEAILEQSEGMESFRELYFSLVIPVATAMKMEEMELAKGLFDEGVKRLKCQYLEDDIFS